MQSLLAKATEGKEVEEVGAAADGSSISLSTTSSNLAYFPIQVVPRALTPEPGEEGDGQAA